LAAHQTPASLFSRLIKPDPYRDLFRVLADSLDEALAVFSSDGEHLIFANHAFILLCGYSRTELVDLDPSSLFAAEGESSIWAQIQSANDEPEHFLAEVAMKTRQGSKVLVDIRAKVIPAPGNVLMLSVTPTRLRLQTERLRQSATARPSLLSEMIKALEQAPPEMMAELLGLSQAALSAAALGLYRVSADAPSYYLVGNLGPEFPQLLDLASLEPFRKASAWNRGQRPQLALQRAARAANLAVLHTAPLGGPDIWIGVLVAGWREAGEVPEEAAALTELMAQLVHAGLSLEARAHALQLFEADNRDLQSELAGQAAAVSDALLSLDQDFKVVRTNPAAEELLGFRNDELIGQPIRDVLVGPEDGMATLLDALGHQRKAERNRLLVHRRDGTPIPVRLKTIPLEDAAGTHLLVILTDQSERQAIEDQTEILAQRALLGEVTAIFAHEVRNPINNISTGVQLVASRLGKDHPLHDSLDKVRRECTRLDQLMTDVLFFARPLELRIEPLDLGDMMQRLLARWEPRFHQAGVQCHTRINPALPRAMVDPRTFEQVVVNLITNALQAMQAGGVLSIQLEPREQAVELRIADTGPGIPPEVVDRIFDPFFTTKKEGTGLGLAISRRILSAHKGGIQVESYPGAGTVFTLNVPASIEPAKDVQA
jgi:two-component system sensor histidine kinase AtoS